MRPDGVAADVGHHAGKEGTGDDGNRDEGVETVGEVHPVGSGGHHEGHEEHEGPAGKIQDINRRLDERDGQVPFAQVRHEAMHSVGHHQGKSEVEEQAHLNGDAVGLGHVVGALQLALSDQALGTNLGDVVDHAHSRVTGENHQDGDHRDHRQREDERHHEHREH